MKKRKTFAICRAVAAVIIAFALLAGSGFAFIPLLRGAQAAPEEGAELQAGAYVQADVRFIMDICAVERSAGGNPVAYYAVAPMGNTFIMLRFPASEYENALAMEQATEDYLNGLSSMDIQLAVTGTTVTMSQEVKGYMEKWFEDNAQQMSQSGLIAAVEDYSVYLNDVALESGVVGSVRQVSIMTAAVLSIAALVLLLYAVLELVLVCAGVYSAERVKNKKKIASVSAAPVTDAAAEPVEGTETPETPETPEAAEVNQPAAVDGNADVGETADVKDDEGGDA